MASDWKTFTLEQISHPNIKAFAMGPFGSNIKKENYRDKGVPIIRGKNLNDERFNLDDFVFLTEEKAEELKGSLAYPNDILFVAQGNIGGIGIIPTAGISKKYVLSQNLMKFSCDQDKAEPLFIFYYFKSNFGQHEINSFSNPTGVPCISQPLSSLKSFKIRLPQLSEQKAIAHILGTLDDKIELNRQMNETLEDMARAIFKSWFVDFDPVRAKVEGRDTGLPPEIAGLFPDSFEDTELGPIPKGWKVKPIGDMVRCVGGGTPSTKELKYWRGGTYPFATPKDMSSLNSPFLLETLRHITEEGVEMISSGAIPKGSVILSSRAPIGYLAITDVPVSVNQGIIAMICDRGLPNQFVLYCVGHNMDKIIGNASGTTFQEISKRNFRPIKIVVPSEKVLRDFVYQVEPLHSKILNNLRETKTIENARDALLPRLISGELRVAEAEMFVRELGL